MSVGSWAFLVAIITMVAFAGLGVAYTRRRAVTIEQFLTARRTTGGTTATATLVASIMGAWILLSPAEAATWAGLVGLVGYGLGQAAPILVFLVVGPRMRRLMPQGHSLSEFVWFRYGKAMYGFALAVMVFYMFVFLAAEMTGIAKAVGLISDVPLGLTAVLVGLATLGYTVYGGLRASIFTDNLQFLLIYPLLLVVMLAVLVQLGGWGPAFDSTREVAPALLSMSHRPGIEFGITLIIAILAANMFHQGFWQRVYACKTERDLRTGFLWAGVLVGPLVIGGGLFGLWAVGRELINAENASVALFVLALDVLPGWAVVTLMALALVLVMSSMDTLLNAIASTFTSDLPRLRPQWGARRLLGSSRVITVVLAGPAMAIAAQGYSVLYLFLIADLVCAGAVVPVFLGLYVRRFTGLMALASAVLGIAAGALFFPTPDFPDPVRSAWWSLSSLTSWWHILKSGDLLASFLAALVVSTAVAVSLSLLASLRRTGKAYDFTELATQVRLIEDDA